MSTVVRIFGGVALMTLAFFMARVGCMALVHGLYTESVFSILAGILGIAMIAGVFAFLLRGGSVVYVGIQRPIPPSNQASG